MSADWILPTPKGHSPCDYRIFLTPGAAQRGRQAFADLSEAERNAEISNTERASFVRDLAASIGAERQSTSSNVTAFKKVSAFFCWADSAGADIRALTMIPLLRQYKDAMSRRPERDALRVLWFIKRTARALNRVEREFLIELFGRASSEWIIDLSNAEPPYFDLRALTFPAFTAMTNRRFSRLPEADKSAHTEESPRVALITEMRLALLAAQDRHRLSGTNLNRSDVAAAWLLVRFLDSRGLTVSHAEVFERVADGTITTATFGINSARGVFKLLSWIARTPEEHSLVQAEQDKNSAYRYVSPDSEWCLHLPQRSPERFDLRLLVVPGAGKRGHPAFIKLTDAKRDALAIEGARKDLVRELAAAWKADLVEGTSPATVQTRAKSFLSLLIWCDARSIAVDRDTVIDALSKFSVYLSNRVRAGTLKPFSASYTVSRIAGSLAAVLNTTTAFVTSHLAGATSKPNSGRMGRYVSSSDATAVMDALNVMIQAVTVATIDSDLPDGLPLRFAGSDIRLERASPSFRGRIPDRFLNSHLIQLRISAELLRFVALTGANKDVALSIPRNAIDWSFDQKGYRIEVFKVRAGKRVVLYIPKWYRPHLERHMEFVSAALGLDGPSSTPLFPIVVADTVGEMRAAVLRGETPRFRPAAPGADIYYLVRATCKRAGIRFLNAQDLRFTLGDYRQAAYNGDSLRASQFLGNTPEVARRHYGGDGNLPQTQREMTIFWARADTLQLSIDPGNCANEDAESGTIDPTDVPTCGPENACFGCEYYRGEESLDYVFLMLTREEELRIRAAHEPPRAGEFTYLIDYIRGIIASYLERNPSHADAVASLRERVRSGDYHPRLARHIEIYRRLHAGVRTKA